MILRELMRGIETLRVEGSMEVGISGISYDSRKTAEGDLFAAVRGESSDGHDFIGKAVEKGAVAVMHQGPAVMRRGAEGREVTYIQVADSRESLAGVANNFYGRPSARLQVIGVTGTNGKTTTTYLIKSILEEWGKKTGLIGTIQYLVGHEVHEATHTTPEAPEFQHLLHEMLLAGCTHVVSEVSSHALAQKRVDGTVFSTAVFTNLTRDHLDFHETMEEYFLAKDRLFSSLLSKEGMAVINCDDEYGRRLWNDCGRGYTYGLGPGADLRAEDIVNSPVGLRFRLVFRDSSHPVESSLIGQHNVYNILAAAGAGLAAGIPVGTVLRGIRMAGNVKGRFERIDAGQPFIAVIDYAHTEDALERTLLTARQLTRGRVITVFGCGGDRDRGKRPRMGEVAARLSDLVIITSDNPRSERPEDIIRDIEAGARGGHYVIEPDRTEAIRRAVKESREGDLLLVAGKGHEEYQEMGGRRCQYSDREVLQETIRRFVLNT